MPDNSGAVNLGDLSPEDQEAVKALAEENEEPQEVLTAFLVLVGKDGSTQVMGFDDPDLVVLTPPTGDLIYGACSNIIRDQETQDIARNTAVATVQAMMMQSRAVAEQMQAQQIREGLRL